MNGSKSLVEDFAVELNELFPADHITVDESLVMLEVSRVTAESVEEMAGLQTQIETLLEKWENHILDRRSVIDPKSDNLVLAFKIRNTPAVAEPS